MGQFTTRVDRLPMVLFLLGLLFIAGGLLVGFENSLAIAGMIFGVLCCVFGIVVFLLQLQESPKKSAATRLSPQFISTGTSVETPAIKNIEDEQATERVTEQSAIN